MPYTTWVSPQRPADDPQSPGMLFAQEFLGSPRSATLCRLATQAWRLSHSRCPMPDTQACLDIANHPVQVGRQNVVFVLCMPDHSLWTAGLRNPLIQKSAVKDKAAREISENMSLASEVATMKYVRSKTTVPVPEVFAYDLDPTNPLGTPYILMEYIRGKPYPYPFDQRGAITETDILKVHCQLVRISAEMKSIRFNSIGQLHEQNRYDDDDEVSCGPLVDRRGRIYGPFDSSAKFFVERARTVHATEMEDRDFEEQVSEMENHQRSLETAALHVAAAPHASHSSSDRGPFPLKHNDLHWQNVLFDQDCVVTGIIDWEWSHTVPVESFRPLPFNLATYILPKDKKLVERHESIAWKIFSMLSDGEAACSVHRCRKRQIAACLDASMPTIGLMLGDSMREDCRHFWNKGMDAETFESLCCCKNLSYRRGRKDVATI